MSYSVECYIDVQIKILSDSIKEPETFLKKLVFSIVSKRDNDLSLEDLDVEIKDSLNDSGVAVTEIKLYCENYHPWFDWKETDERVLDTLTQQIEDKLEKRGAEGTVNIYGYYMDQGPDISSFRYIGRDKTTQQTKEACTKLNVTNAS